MPVIEKQLFWHCANDRESYSMNCLEWSFTSRWWAWSNYLSPERRGGAVDSLHTYMHKLQHPTEVREQVRKSWYTSKNSIDRGPAQSILAYELQRKRR